MLDRRHTILEETKRLYLIKRSNDYAVYSRRHDTVIAAFPFNLNIQMGPTVAEKRARELYEYADTNDWR